MLFVLTAALALAGPDLDLLVHAGGYPAGAEQRGRSAAALVRVLVDPDGRVVRCETMAMVGYQDLAAQACVRARHRKVRPAVDAGGAAAWSQATTMVQFYAPGLDEADEVARNGPGPDAELTVSRLPGGARQTDLKVVLAVDEHGVATDCAIDPGAAPQKSATGSGATGSGATGVGAVGLVRAVCASRAALGLKPVTAPDGRALRYVAPLTVRLTASG